MEEAAGASAADLQRWLAALPRQGGGNFSSTGR
jgi:hypothetical protein